MGNVQSCTDGILGQATEGIPFFYGTKELPICTQSGLVSESRDLIGVKFGFGRAFRIEILLRFFIEVEPDDENHGEYVKL